MVLFILSIATVGFADFAFAKQKAKVYICTMDSDVRSSKPGRCKKCGMTLVLESSVKGTPLDSAAQKSESDSKSTQANKQSTKKGAESKTAVENQKSESSDEEFTCSMHPEIRSKTNGKCPKCAMPLVPVNPGIVDEFVLKMEATPFAPKPNEKVKFRFSIFNPKTGAAEKDFALLHEKLFHLFIVSQDLSQFQHIHPAFNADGSFSIETVLPQAGRYKIYCDFYPVDGSPQVLQQNISTAGYKEDLFGAKPIINPEEIFTKVVEGEKIKKENAENLGVVLSALKPTPANNMKVELVIEPEQIIAGKQTTLKYHLFDAKTGEPIKDLSPYLGAWGHTLILSEDQTDYVHSHPTELPPSVLDLEEVDESKFLGGPNVTFEAMFPRPGKYKIWTQFLRGDTITTVTFMVRAERLR